MNVKINVVENKNTHFIGRAINTVVNAKYGLITIAIIIDTTAVMLHLKQNLIDLTIPKELD